MVKPGVIVQGRMRWAPRQQPQLVVEQNERQRYRQRQIGKHAAQTDHEDRNEHQLNIPEIRPTGNPSRRSNRCASLVRTARRTARQRWRAVIR